MIISLSELKNDPDKYIDLATREDIQITRHGMNVAVLVSAQTDRSASAKALFGILPPNVDECSAREERLR